MAFVNTGLEYNDPSAKSLQDSQTAIAANDGNRMDTDLSADDIMNGTATNKLRDRDK